MTSVEAAGYWYDGGTGEIPGGLTGPVQRVIIVGAGIAGLTTASALRRGGIDCVVLEARDRIGGRLHTIQMAGSAVDLGGSWIHHPAGNPLRAFADQVGVTCRDGDPMPEMTGYDRGEHRRLTTAELDAVIATEYEEFPDACADLLSELGPTASIATAIDVFVAAADLDQAAARRARQALRAGVEGESASAPEHQSLAWMWNESEYDGGDYFGDLPVGGYRMLVDAMATGIDVRLGVEVVTIHASDDGVAVETADGATEEGTHVLITVPLGVLKAGKPRFVPPLPPERLAAIDRLGYGNFEKIVMRFERAFWREAGLPHLVVFPAEPDRGTVWIVGQDGFDGGAILVAFIFHSECDRVLDGTPEAAADWILDMYDDAIGEACPRPVEIRCTSWGSDPFSAGSWSHITPESTPADVDLLGEPLFGRVLFAGEHTQSTRLVYVDGAMASGVREAKRLLQQPRVRLGPEPGQASASGSTVPS